MKNRTTTRRALLRLTAAILFLPVFAHACDFCGAFLGVTPFDNENSFSFTHRYRVFNGYPAMNQTSGFFPSGAYRVSPAYSALHGGTDSLAAMSHSDFESYKVFELRARWFIHPRVEVNVILPFVDNKQKMDGEETHVSGFGDISFFAGWHVMQRLEDVKVRQRLIVGMGIKLPTGRSNALYDDGDRVPVMLQAGTGSTDGFAWLAYTAAAGNWRWGVTSLGKFNGANKYEEQIRPSTVNTAFGAYQIQSCSWVILPQVQVYQEYVRGIQEGAVLEEGTGMNMVLLGPGVECYWKKFGFNIGAQFPVYQKTDEMNMNTAGRLMAGISYNLEAKKYLFK